LLWTTGPYATPAANSHHIPAARAHRNPDVVIAAGGHLGQAESLVERAGTLVHDENVGPESECGWGLLLVESLGKQWGSCRKSTGKVVWVQI
jgi:hypothetical protein